MNRNWEEEIDVPVGPKNSFAPGEADRGQPTHFLPRRNRFVFRVSVPEGFSDTDEMVWTLTTKGKEEKAYATLRLDYLVDDLVKASEQGAIGAGTTDAVIRGNTAPQLRVEGDAHRAVRVGEPLTMVAWASDDGVPKSRRRGSSRRASTSGTYSTTRPEMAAASSDHRWQHGWAAPLVVRLPWRRHRDVPSLAGQGVGGHPGRRELAMGESLDHAARAARRPVGGAGDVRPAGHLRPPLPGL